MAGRILTTEQAAELLQVDVGTVRRWLRRGRIPGRRIARDWRISEDALNEWVRRGEPKARVPLYGKLAHLKTEGEQDHTAAFLREKHEDAERDDARLSGADPRK